jgi:aminocarboxymuconate-semialdehyde decarboxylase
MGAERPSRRHGVLDARVRGHDDRENIVMQPVIDCHAHMVPPEMWRAMLTDGTRYGVEIGGTDERRMIRLAGSTYVRPMYMPLTATHERIAAMDRQGVDMQVLSGYIDFSGYTMPLELGTRFAELQNETIAGVVAANPDRYVGAANVPLQDAATAVKVMTRARRDYGFRAVQVAPYFGGKTFLDDAALDPFWAAAQEMETLILFHPYDEQPAAGLGDYFLHNCIGYPLQTTIAVVRMMFSGVFTRFPDLRMRVPHAGGFLPYQIERFRHAADFRPEPRAKGFSGDPRDTLRRLYYDTVTFDPAPLRYLVDLVGADRLLLGSDFPFEMGDPDPVATVRAAVAPEHQDKVLGGTLRRLLCLEPACGCGTPRDMKAEGV